ncbi:uncharacterized protein MYCGRDRAFT_46150, partial [Zymoseptoria tritici IPO323]
PIRLNIDSSASTSKSYLIKLLSARLQAIAIVDGNKPNPIARVAPTRSAIYNIRSSIIYTFLLIPVVGKFAPL